jgi:hypothetical protein
MIDQQEKLKPGNQLSPNMAEYVRTILYIYDEMVAKQEGPQPELNTNNNQN